MINYYLNDKGEVGKAFRESRWSILLVLIDSLKVTATRSQYSSPFETSQRVGMDFAQLYRHNVSVKQRGERLLI